MQYILSYSSQGGSSILCKWCLPHRPKAQAGPVISHRVTYNVSTGEITTRLSCNILWWAIISTATGAKKLPASLTGNLGCMWSLWREGGCPQRPWGSGRAPLGFHPFQCRQNCWCQCRWKVQAPLEAQLEWQGKRQCWEQGVGHSWNFSKADWRCNSMPGILQDRILGLRQKFTWRVPNTRNSLCLMLFQSQASFLKKGCVFISSIPFLPSRCVLQQTEIWMLQLGRSMPPSIHLPSCAH